MRPYVASEAVSGAKRPQAVFALGQLVPVGVSMRFQVHPESLRAEEPPRALLALERLLEALLCLLLGRLV